MKPYVASAVTPIFDTCSPLTKKMSSFSGVTIRASLSPFCREGKKKVRKCKDVTLAPELNHLMPMGKDGMILTGGYAAAIVCTS